MMVCDSRSVCLSVLQRASVQSCTEGLKTCLVVGYDIPIRSKDSLSVEISINMRRRAHYIISTESRGQYRPFLRQNSPTLLEFDWVEGGVDHPACQDNALFFRATDIKNSRSQNLGCHSRSKDIIQSTFDGAFRGCG